MNSFSLTGAVIGVEATSQIFNITSNIFLQSGGDTPSAAAYSAFVLQNNASSASGVLRAILIDSTLSAGTVTTYRGIEIGTFTLGATITDSSGIFIDNTIPNSSSTHFAIQSLSTARSLITGPLLTSRLVVVDADGATLTAELSWSVISNEGASAEANFTLPTAAANLEFTFIVQDSSGLKVTAASGDTIRLAGAVSATAGNVASTTIGDTITLVAINATEWVAIKSVGTGWVVT
jgi:hypothetical protein